MLISISDLSLVAIEGGQQHPTEEPETEIFVFSSPGHPAVSISGAVKPPYTKTFRHDSIATLDKKRNKLIFKRDWPGNVQTYYWYNASKTGKTLVICNNLSKMIKQIPNPRPSREGVNLFLLDRKHHHSHTLYNGVEVLRPGFQIEYDLSSGQMDLSAWYKPCSPINVFDEEKAVKIYRDSIDSCLKRLIDPSLPVALMFSGGSDSTFLVERCRKLGMKDLTLFNIKIKDEVTLAEEATFSAAEYGQNVKFVEVDKSQIFSDWLKLFKKCYHYLSDMRIDGIFSPSIQLFKRINEVYQGRPVNILWGSQYALASPRVSTAQIVRIYFAFIISKLKKFSLDKPLGWRAKLYLRLFKAQVFDKIRIHPQQLKAHQDLYLKAGNEAKHPDELINLNLSLNYNHLKHWWMDWRDIVKKEYCPNGKNLYPFHDREFQESTMPFSLSVRAGGCWNLLKMPKYYKAFFKKAFEDPVSVKQFFGHNKKSEISYFKVFRNRAFFEKLLAILDDPKNRYLVDYFENSIELKVPRTFEEFEKLDSGSVERLSGIVIILTRFEVDGIDGTSELSMRRQA